MQERFAQFNRKTIPQGDRGSRLHQNGDAPQFRVETERFNLGQTKAGRLQTWNQIDVVRPLLPFTFVPVGGGRPIGGGTSKEALRRAKQDLKRR